VATHDILIYDDDALRGNLASRCLLARDALERLRASLPTQSPCLQAATGAQILGFGTRESLLAAIEQRAKTDWAIGLIDLQDADGSMRGARIVRTIREHPELRGRCIPAALTVHANPAMQRALRPWAFALVAVASVGSATTLSTALAELYARHPTEETPDCSAFPEAEEPGGWPGFAENFARRFGVRPRFGDDLVMRHIDRDIPATVTDARLHEAAAGSRGQWRRSVEDFKTELARAKQWETASVAPMVRAFLSDMVRLDFDDPINPKEINTAATLWHERTTRRQTRIPVTDAPAVDAFFKEFQQQLLLSSGSPQNASKNEKAFVAARAAVVESHSVNDDWINYVLQVLLDVSREPA
jgi:CheY-like chemotaxis protein